MHILRGHTQEDNRALNEAVGSERLNERKGSSQVFILTGGSESGRSRGGQKWRDEKERRKRARRWQKYLKLTLLQKQERRFDSKPLCGAFFTEGSAMQICKYFKLQA